MQSLLHKRPRMLISHVEFDHTLHTVYDNSVQGLKALSYRYKMYITFVIRSVTSILVADILSSGLLKDQPIHSWMETCKGQSTKE